MKLKYALIVILLGFFTVQGCFAYENIIQTGRYLTVSNKPTHAQLDLLSQNIQVHFPQSVQTVGQAMTYLLRFSGYGLVDRSKMNEELRVTLSGSLKIFVG